MLAMAVWKRWKGDKGKMGKSGFHGELGFTPLRYIILSPHRSQGRHARSLMDFTIKRGSGIGGIVLLLLLSSSSIYPPCLIPSCPIISEDTSENADLVCFLYNGGM